MMDVFFPPPLLCFPSLFVVIRAVMRWFRWYIWLIAMPSARNLWGMAIEVFPKNSPRSHLVIRFRCRMTIMSFWLLMKGHTYRGIIFFVGNGRISFWKAVLRPGQFTYLFGYAPNIWDRKNHPNNLNYFVGGFLILDILIWVTLNLRVYQYVPIRIAFFLGIPPFSEKRKTHFIGPQLDHACVDTRHVRRCLDLGSASKEPHEHLPKY